jgi:uncharacterized protein YerC
MTTEQMRNRLERAYRSRATPWLPRERTLDAYADLGPLAPRQRAALISFMRRLDPKAGLRPRERRALAVELLAEGVNAPAIADQLGISRATMWRIARDMPERGAGHVKSGGSNGSTKRRNVSNGGDPVRRVGLPNRAPEKAAEGNPVGGSSAVDLDDLSRAIWGESRSR